MLLLLVLLCALAAPGCARRYRVEGMVVAVDHQQKSVVVSHRAIPGYMPAMVMPFPVRQPRDLETLRPGTRVRFELVAGRGASQARRFVIENSAQEGLGESGEKFRFPTPAEKIAVGAPMPDFELVDQAPRPVRLSQFAGKVVAVNFIYTRCPLPEVCPRLSASFASMRRRFRDRLGSDLVLLSITLDPRYDTPAVLARYARELRADGEAWRFLTGPPEAVEAVARRFGLVHWPEEGMIVHTSVTAVIARDGRLSAVVEGSSFRLEQLSDLISHNLEMPSR